MMKPLAILFTFALQALASPLVQGAADLATRGPGPRCPIQPKKVGYFWVGTGDDKHADFLALYSLDDDTFGQQLAVVDIPTTSNSAHHISVSADGKTLSTGGLLSFAKEQPSMYLFNVSDPYKPSYIRSIKAPLSSATDEMRLMPNGGFMISNMGSATGDTPGRLVEMDVNYNILGEYPKDLATLTNTGDPTAEQFSPHGLHLLPEKNIMISTDFVIPKSLLKPSKAVQHANNLRIWDMTTKEILNTIHIANGSGINDVKFIPSNNESAAIATAVGLGQAWIVYPFRKNANGRQGTAEFLVDLGLKKPEAAIYVDITQDAKYAYFSLTLNSRVVQLDISNLSSPKRLHDPSAPFPYIGTHYIKISPDQKHIGIIDYFVQTGDVGIVNVPGDFKALYADIGDDGRLDFKRSIDFAKDFESEGGAKPHSVVFFDLTDPEHPKYW